MDFISVSFLLEAVQICQCYRHGNFVENSNVGALCSGGSGISPRRGRQLPRGGANIRFCHIFPKTAWNWKNLGPRRGGGRIPRTPLRSATALDGSHPNMKFFLSLVENQRENNSSHDIHLYLLHCNSLKAFWWSICVIRYLSSCWSSISQTGVPTPEEGQKPTIWQDFCWKPHEMKDIAPRRGACFPGASRIRQ